MAGGRRRQIGTHTHARCGVDDTRAGGVAAGAATAYVVSTNRRYTRTHAHAPPPLPPAHPLPHHHYLPLDGRGSRCCAAYRTATTCHTPVRLPAGSPPFPFTSDPHYRRAACLLLVAAPAWSASCLPFPHVPTANCALTTSPFPTVIGVNLVTLHPVPFICLGCGPGVSLLRHVAQCLLVGTCTCCRTCHTRPHLPAQQAL